MTVQYKRKFLVPGDTIKTCWDFRKQCQKQFGSSLPCRKGYSRDESKCPFPINKPNDYIVSETVEGEWQCSCKAWTAHMPRQDCKHIDKARANPEKYEISVDFTEKLVKVTQKICG